MRETEQRLGSSDEHRTDQNIFAIVDTLFARRAVHNSYIEIFQNRFFTEIYFRFHNLQFYTPTARLRGGRPP